MTTMSIVLGCTALGCKRPVPATPVPAVAPLPPLVMKGDAGLLFTYVGPEGTFVTTDKTAEVPPQSRHLVRVVDPSRGVAESRDNTNVYVADLNQFIASGNAQAKPLSRAAFETGALAALPPGRSSMLSGPRELAEADPATLAPGDPGGAAASPPLPLPRSVLDRAAPVVTVYGTSWCGACRSARQYLTQRRIPFADKDIEKDPEAARELSEKAARLGVPTDRVPILDVRGRLLIGFDQARLETLLGEAS